jgi:hypothetical protein
LAAIAACAILALGPAAATLPKPTDLGVTLAPPIFDHSKVALIDEIIRSGVPAQNPFFHESGAPDRVAYYYLWHFSAALAGRATGVSGWEADAAVTWFTAFSSLLVMLAIAFRIGVRPWALLVVVALAGTSSLRRAIQWLWPDGAPAAVGWTTGFGGWLFQVSWAPQHVASAVCVVIACWLIPRLDTPRDWTAAIVSGLAAAAAFQSSVWVGGVVLPIAAVAIGIHAVWTREAAQRRIFIVRAFVAGCVALALIAPFVFDQIMAAAARGTGSVVALRPVDVFGVAVPDQVRRVLNVPGYWLLYLPIEFPAFFIAGMAGFALLVRQRSTAHGGALITAPLLTLAAISLCIAWLLASVISDNNDLGWRAVLPAVLVLVPLAAYAISRPGAHAVRAIAAAGFLLSLPGMHQTLHENLFGVRRMSEPGFAQAPQLWDAVRRHASPADRVANNPMLFGDMTGWPVNISWALLANRRSCYAGNDLAVPFAPISNARRAEINAQFGRVFSGRPAAQDVQQLAGRFGCDVVVIVPQDGAWQRDPFAASELYRLADSKPEWRIYRRTGAASPPL